MKALIFAAGVGSRLKPWTDEHPKALAPVGGIPMLERVILKLKALGITEMVVNVHHFSQQIIDFLQSKEYFGITIHISDESDLLLDTGGGMLRARQWLEDGDFLVHNADILTDVDIRPMYVRQQRYNPLATLLVAPRETSRYLVFYEGPMKMVGWHNVKTGETIPANLEQLYPIMPGTHSNGLIFRAFNGIHICSPAIFPLLQQYADEHGPVFSITPFYVEACQSHVILGYGQSAPYSWLDIGKPATLAEANQIISSVQKPTNE